MLYSRKAFANKAAGQPLVHTAPRVFESAPAGYFNVEGAVAAGGGSGDNNDDDDDDDNDNNNNGKQKPSGGGIILVPRAERQRDHRGMVSVTTMTGDHKRNATDGPV